MTWDAHNHREEVLRAVIDEADRRRDGILPMEVAGVADTFGDELALVGALQLRWHTRLAGTIERALTDQPSDLEGAVLRAWRSTARELPGVRLALDACAAAPASEAIEKALRIANRKERSLLAAMAGQASVQDAVAARVGYRLELKARAGFDPTADLTPEVAAPASAAASTSLLGRLIAHLAA